MVCCGVKYEGMWKEGRLEGKMTMTLQKGATHSGVAKDGRFYGEGMVNGVLLPLFPRTYSFDEF